MREFQTAACIAMLIVTVGVAGCSRQVEVADSPTEAPSGTALLTSDLNRLKAGQAQYKTEKGRYTSSLGALGITPSDGVSVSIIQADAGGYSAIASNDKHECAIYVGDVRAPRGYVNGPDAVFCRS